LKSAGKWGGFAEPPKIGKVVKIDYKFWEFGFLGGSGTDRLLSNSRIKGTFTIPASTLCKRSAKSQNPGCIILAALS